MMFTAADIQAEHLAALAALTPQQRRALERLRNARQHARFNGRYPEENLSAMFEAEAAQRTQTVAEAPPMHRAA